MSDTFKQFLLRMKEEHPAYHLNYYNSKDSMIENRIRLRKGFTILDSGYQRCENIQFYYVKVARK